MRNIIALSLLAIMARPVVGQQADSLSIAGNWRFDPATSDSIPGASLAAPTGPRPPVDGIGGGATSGGRGGGRRGAGGSGSGSTPGGLGSPGGPGMNDSRMRTLMRDLRPTQVLIVGQRDSAIVIRALGVAHAWVPDGKWHPEAQLEGGTLEFMASWKKDALVLEHGLPNGATVRRELRVVDGGRILEVRTQTRGMPGKLEYTARYTRELPQ